MQNQLKEKSIAFIGIGIMGRSMAAHLMNAGCRLFVYNRTKEKAATLIQDGAVWCDSPADASKTADFVITMVGFPADVEDVYFGANGILSTVREGACLIDMTTTRPDIAVRIYEAAVKKGAFSIDAPVSGGDKGAREAALSIMAGGDREVFERALPMFQILGKNIVYQGKPGSGQHAKICNQIAVASNTVGACEAIAYAKKAGLDPSSVLQSIEKGAAGSWSLSNLVPRVLAGNYAPGFYVKHMIKDLGIALDSARKLNLDLPGLVTAESLYKKLEALHGGDVGTQALFRLYE